MERAYAVLLISHNMARNYSQIRADKRSNAERMTKLKALYK